MRMIYKESQVSETLPFLHQDFFLKVVHSGAQGQYSTRQSAPFDQILLSWGYYIFFSSIGCFVIIFLYEENNNKAHLFTKDPPENVPVRSISDGKRNHPRTPHLEKFALLLLLLYQRMIFCPPSVFPWQYLQPIVWGTWSSTEHPSTGQTRMQQIPSQIILIIVHQGIYRLNRFRGKSQKNWMRPKQVGLQKDQNNSPWLLIALSCLDRWGHVSIREQSPEHFWHTC